MEQAIAIHMGLCADGSPCGRVQEVRIRSRQTRPLLPLQNSDSTIAQAMRAPAAISTEADVLMEPFYCPWHLCIDDRLRDGSQASEGGINQSSLVWENLGFAEKPSTLTQRCVLFDMESHAKCVLEKFASDEESDGHRGGRNFTSESVNYLPDPKVYMEQANERKRSLMQGRINDVGQEHHAKCDNSCIDFITGCGKLQKALDMDVVRCNAVLKSFCDSGRHEDALQLLNYMLHLGIQPRMRAFATIFRALPDEDMLEKGRCLHLCIAKSGRTMNTFVGNSLIRMFAKVGSPRDARMVFDKLPHKDTVTWNLMIGVYNQHNGDQQALELFHQMVHFGIQPNAITFLCVLKACSGMGALEQGKNVHLYTVESGLDSVVSVGATLIDMYAKCGNLEVACAIFNRLPERDLVTWSVLISGHSNHGYSKDAIRLFDHFQGEGLKPDRVICACVIRAYSDAAALDPGMNLHSYIIEMGLELDATVGSALIDMYTKCGTFDDSSVIFSRLERQDVFLWSVYMARFVEKGFYLEVLKLFEKMQQVSMEPDKVTFISVLNACASLAHLDHGKQVHSHVIGHGFELDLSVGSALIDMYMKTGSLLDAQMVFQKLREQDVVTWSSLTAGYVHLGRFEEALDLYLFMQQEGVKPNQVTFASTLKACSSLLALNEGKQMHIQITQSGYEQNLFVANGLIDMYGKCGGIQDAQAVFYSMHIRDGVTWNAMIAAYTKNECAFEALESFKQMSQADIEPDRVSFVGVLKACSTMSALQQGMRIHSGIVGIGIESDNFVGSALIDMYSKCGSLEDACTVFQRWLNLDVVMWSAMITAYVHHGRYMHAFNCFMEMQGAGVKPNDVTFLCILSACSRLGLVSAGCFQFKMMKVAYAIEPVREHFNALVDLLVHAGRWAAAEDLLETVSVSVNTEGWTTLLGACKRHANVALGRRCFDNLLRMDPRHGTGHAIMKNLYVSAGMHDEAEKLDTSRKLANLWKKPAKAYIEIEEQIHTFTVGDTSHPKSNEIYQKLRSVSMQMQSLGLDFREGVVAGTKDDTSCGHCEKLAVAFGLLCTPRGLTVRVSKNLKMCTDCHNATKMMSKIELREIIVTDLYCAHHFKEGACSCESGNFEDPYFFCHFTDV